MFETREAALLTMRVQDLILRSIAKRCVSKDAPEQLAAPSAPHIQVSQYETGPAGAADAVAEIVGGGARVGADPHLIERSGASITRH